MVAGVGQEWMSDRIGNVSGIWNLDVAPELSRASSRLFEIVKGLARIK